MNIAARLEGLAEPGGICIARNVHDQIKAKLALPFEPMGQHRVKNIAEPVEVWRVAARWRGDGRRWRVGLAPRLRAARAGFVPALAALLALVFAGGVWHFWPDEPAPKGQARNRGAAVR